MAKIAIKNSSATIPATLHDLLAARIDSMGEAKQTEKLAATLGREFDLELVTKISQGDGKKISLHLRVLQNPV